MWLTLMVALKTIGNLKSQFYRNPKLKSVGIFFQAELDTMVAK